MIIIEHSAYRWARASGWSWYVWVEDRAGHHYEQVRRSAAMYSSGLESVRSF